MFVGAAATFDKKTFPKLLAPKLRGLILELADDTRPGDLGQVASTLTGATPHKLVVGVLPDRVARYNAAARPEAIFRVVATSGLAREKKGAIVLLLDDEAHVVPALNALGRAFPLFHGKSDAAPNGKVAILVCDTTGEPLRISDEARAVFKYSREVAALVDTPPSELHPEQLAAQARAMLSDVPEVGIEELVGDALLERGLGGLHAVGRAALKPPRLLIASWKPKNAGKRHIALVGKGITFDTGGLHLKARGAMETMKSDMGGAAAVLGAFRALVALEAPVQLSLVLCLAENAVGPGAFKPDDILKMHSGKTVEINNTDAEGRLVLADGCSYAARILGADTVIDAATLTGSQLIATGMMHAAVISNDASLEQQLIESGFRSGDLVHPLPFAPEFYKAEFKSPVADMRNSVKNRSNAQSSCAAQFIYNHLDGLQIRWGHIDLAGPAFRNDRGTGFGVALLTDLVQRL